eukprot:TRINITY_DN69626_c0_g1_i1.p1 TRINITY_DN69626_c0_g1~~TRINITY_DN69626_c0_g1_i1.p1  ORF type:complete len:111 (+),score=15.69 TRINITY_DN69626_c0_g1_i1:38-334(+)
MAAVSEVCLDSFFNDATSMSSHFLFVVLCLPGLSLCRGPLVVPSKLVLDGSGLGRTQAFLLKASKPATRKRYAEALIRLNGDLESQKLVWASMSNDER